MEVKMDLNAEIEKLAKELYVKSGRIEGRDLENWLEAEKILMKRHASKKKKSAPQQKETKLTAKRTTSKKKY
jgi:hypothetical protein